MKRLLLLIILPFIGYPVLASEDCFDRIAKEKGLDADLLRAIAFVESSGNPSAVGRNASNEDYGLMQINSTWLKRFKTSKSELLNDACFNVQVGAEILADNFSRASHRRLQRRLYSSQRSGLYQCSPKVCLESLSSLRKHVGR